MLLLPTFRLPTLIHTRSGNAKYLAEISHRNPLWIHTGDARRLGIGTGDLVRVTTEIGHFVNRAWVTESIAPGVVACSHHLGRWRLHEGEGSRWSTSAVRLAPHEGGWLLRQVEGMGPFRERDPDSSRIFWSDGGVHQNLAFPVHPDPVSGMHCWHQKVVVARAPAGRPLRRRVRGHQAVDGGLPRVAGPRPARSGAGRAAAPAVAGPPPAADGGRVPESGGLMGARRRGRRSLDRVRAIVRESVVLLEPDFLAGGMAAIEPRIGALRERVREEGLLAPHLPPPAGAPGCPWPCSAG